MANMIYYALSQQVINNNFIDCTMKDIHKQKPNGQLLKRNVKFNSR